MSTLLSKARRFAAAAAVLIAGGVTGAQAADVRVGFIPVAGSGQLFVIDGEGWAKDAGLNLKLTQFESGPAMISALASGTLDAYYGGIGPIMVASARGIDVKVYASAAIEEMTVVGRGDFGTQANAATAAGFKEFAEREGRPVRFATQPPGSVPDTVLRYWLQNVVKADPATYQITAMGIEATQQALLAGAVDAATIREPTLTVVQQRDPNTKLLALGGQMLPNQPGSVLALTGAFVKANPEAAKSLVALNTRATTLLKEEPDRAAKHLQKGLGKGITDLATFEKAVVSPASKFVADPMTIKDATGVMQDFQLQLGVLEKAADLDVLFDDSFYRASVR
ncbi:ABC transporter substrate-binding protein [Skermanella mucosa]|uniref:ABC transporter substrate-binding protein n=1 Tax=Skermanella mucosa TaxID=1789672 RepID=UPI00192AA09F|nr:ABC transporter substrate-binding protein [Skermanella mucosa]UEM21191.1 ABC transporter substrate-binding protein [Skermanella mucosa]